MSNSKQNLNFQDIYSNFKQLASQNELDILRLNHIYDYTLFEFSHDYKISRDDVINSINERPKHIHIFNKVHILSKNMMFAMSFIYKLGEDNIDLSYEHIIKLQNILKYGIDSTNTNLDNIALDDVAISNKKQLHEFYNILSSLNFISNYNNNIFMSKESIINYISLTLIPNINRLKSIIKCNKNLDFLINYWLLKNNLGVLDLYKINQNILLINNNIKNIKNTRKQVNTNKILEELDILLSSEYENLREFIKQTNNNNANAFKQIFNFNLFTQKDTINNWYLKKGRYSLEHLTINDFYGDDNLGKGFTKEFKNALITKSNYSDWLYGQEIPNLPSDLFDIRDLVDFHGYLDTINYEQETKDNAVESFVYEISIANIKKDVFLNKYRQLVENLILLFRTKEMSVRYFEFIDVDNSIITQEEVNSDMHIVVMTIVSDSHCPNEYSFSFQSFKKKFPIETTITINRIQK